MDNLKKEGVIILDFGSQYTQLIARRIREFNVYSEVVPPEIGLNSINEKNPKAIILSGGPSSVFSIFLPVSCSGQILSVLRTILRRHMVRSTLP